jgi:hypothetical protein
MCPGLDSLIENKEKAVGNGKNSGAHPFYGNLSDSLGESRGYLSMPFLLQWQDWVLGEHRV